MIVVVVVARPPGQIQRHGGGQRWRRRTRAMSQAAAATGGGSDGDRRVPHWLSVAAQIWISNGVTLKGHALFFTHHHLHAHFHAPPFSRAEAASNTCRPNLGCARFCHLTFNPGL